ncbi:MAG: flagellar biosynthetic protein FliR [Gammaproteobacteria bacterium]|jgi:flagellar biosynthetic protein FliR|nr:flagellar biosynthetic protein FliR [Gammaproteobacteria bacterium]
MTFFVAELVEMLQTFMWPFVRVSAVMMTAPLFSQRAMNLRLRILIGFVLTWMIYPFIVIPQVDPFSIGALYGLFNEVTVGALMGVTLQIVTAAIVVSGHAVSSSMGLGMANMMDPNLGNVPTLSQFLLIIGLLVFLALGGHLVLISVLVQSFTSVPVGSGLLSTDAISGFLAWSSQVFIGAVIMVLPVMLGLLMINACLGVISRASPSLNVFAVGFPALIPIGFGMVLLSMVVIISKMEGLWFQAFQTLNENMLGL